MNIYESVVEMPRHPLLSLDVSFNPCWDLFSPHPWHDVYRLNQFQTHHGAHRFESVKESFCPADCQWTLLHSYMLSVNSSTRLPVVFLAGKHS